MGKTEVTVALMRWASRQGLNVTGMKPVACGCVPTDEGLRNDDALRLLKASPILLTYDEVNPYAYESPISPHLAARMAMRPIDLADVAGRCRDLERRSDGILVEGIGGWEVPLGEGIRVSHLARSLGLPVILVVAMRLGCLNHALLTHEAILLSGLECAGWIANDMTGCMANLEANIETLKSELSTPCLGVLAHRNGDVPASGEGGQSSRFYWLSDDEILRRLRG
ncbi:dethiobiotin synthase [Methylococcus sp. EFPC2]|uniref:dethiobiotin synthase n=1 Tax=Methylococcus sp. EFPC2 TaxID=2812648 RepID=UPI001F073CA8|nr:dethiobiotin synthase [Methylococcus sp. EFPC2]